MARISSGCILVSLRGCALWLRMTASSSVSHTLIYQPQYQHWLLYVDIVAPPEKKPDAKTISAYRGPDGHLAPPYLALLHLAPLLVLPMAAGHCAMTAVAAAHFQFRRVDFTLCTSQIRDFERWIWWTWRQAEWSLAADLISNPRLSGVIRLKQTGDIVWCTSYHLIQYLYKSREAVMTLP